MFTAKRRSVNIIFLCVLFAALAISTIWGVTPAYAQPAGEDTFEVVFPKTGYFQSQNPTLVAANENYLIVLDAPEKRLYARSAELSTYFYDITSVYGERPDVSVTDIFAVGHHAYIVTSDLPTSAGVSPTLQLYGVDISDASSQVSLCEVSSPERIYCFASDGADLYAKNAKGELTIYGEDLSIKRDGIYNDVLAGKASFAGHGDRIYIFTTDQSMPRLYIYDSEADEVVFDEASKLVRTAYIGSDVIFAQLSPSEDIVDHSCIICLDKETGEPLYTSSFMPESFCAYGDKLYSINNGSVTGYRFNQSEQGCNLEREETITMAGNDLLHFNAPADILTDGNKTVIADSENNRLAFVDLSAEEPSVLPFALDDKPTRLAGNAEGAYALLQNGQIANVTLSNGEYTLANVLNSDEDALAFEDILFFDGTLYGVTATGLYAYIVNGFIPVDGAQFEGARRITAAEDGNAIYVLTDDEILMFGGDGGRLPTSLKGNFEDVKDFAADYNGDLQLLYENRVVAMKNRVSSLEMTAETQFASTTYAATAVTCALVGSELYFTTEQCFIGKLEVQASAKDDYAAPALPVPDESTAFRFVKLKDGASSYFIPASDGRADSALPASKNVLLVLDALGDLDDGLAYALDADKMYIIPIADFEDVAPIALGGNYLFKQDGTLYAIPYFDSLSLSVPERTQGVVAVSDCAGYDNNKWEIVTFNGKTYFVDPACLEEDLAPPQPPVDPDDPERPEPPKPVYGRAKAGRVGGVVYIYSNMAEAEISARVVDGKRVQILATFDGYYQVKYGEIIGFMRASEVKVGGLTTVQIVAIVLSALVLAAGTGIMISISAIKKRSDAADSEK